jgi:predicted TIM-barrel fold metal-dependent hydrolase
VRESLDEIRRCVRDGPMVGIKLWIARKATDPGVDAILEEAARLGVPVLQHAWLKTTGNYEHESIPADVAEAARRHSETIIQMAHLYGAGERGLQDIAPYPNVLVDTSGGDPEAGLLEYATSLLGAERIVFGSDAPGRDFSVPLGKVIGADLTLKQKDLIFSGNATRIYRLEG